MPRRLLLLAYGLLLLTGCGPTTKQLMARAALDFGCDRAELQTTRLDKRTYHVTGCGRRATYVSSCLAGDDCSWVLNSPVESDGPTSGGEAQAEAEEVAVREDARIETARAKDGSKQLKLYMRTDFNLLYVSATPRTDGQRASFVWRVPKSRPDTECEIKIVADGMRVDFATETKLSARTENLDYRATLAYESLMAMAKSARVAARLCDVELALTDTQLNKLRELVVRIREEQAWDEEPQRNEEEAEVAPTEL